MPGYAKPAPEAWRKVPERRSLIEFVARTGDDKLPYDITSRQSDRALGDPQRLVGKLVGIVVERLRPGSALPDLERAIPQRTRAKGFLSLAADLPLAATVLFEKPLVAHRAVEENPSVRPDLGGGDQKIQLRAELLVKLAG